MLRHLSRTLGFLACCLCAASAIAALSRNSPEDPLVCFVVRTYWGHGKTYGDQSLLAFIESLQAQKYDRWEALFLVLDDQPFPDLAQILRSAKDDRLRIFAEWVKHTYKPKDSNGMWSTDYHKHLYKVTDEAVHACSPETRWVVITNGDNLYDSSFLSTLMEPESSGKDAVAFDFYSRYQRPTAPPCERFKKWEPGSVWFSSPVPPCKENRWRFCQTDLGATALNWKRFVEENHHFGTVDEQGDGQASDGIMSSVLQDAGWKVRRIAGRCLMAHNPSPQTCAINGGVWDDSTPWHAYTMGGQCVTPEKARSMITQYPDSYEVVAMNITFDPNSFSFAQLTDLPLSCLRASNPNHWGTVQDVFGKVCSAYMDRPALRQGLVHAWDAWAKDEL